MPYFNTRLTAVLLLFLIFGALSCGGGIDTTPAATPEACLDREIARIKRLPEQDFLNTLDGRRVSLSEFFTMCQQLGSKCALYPKFYHWPTETIETRSQSTDKLVTHRMRVYYNPLSTCYPERIDPRRIHGDVAEVYNADGAFIGIAVYMGQGLYVPLPYSGHRPLPSETPLPEKQ